MGKLVSVLTAILLGLSAFPSLSAESLEVRACGIVFDVMASDGIQKRSVEQRHRVVTITARLPNDEAEKTLVCEFRVLGDTVPELARLTLDGDYSLAGDDVGFLNDAIWKDFNGALPTQ